MLQDNVNTMHGIGFKVRLHVFGTTVKNWPLSMPQCTNTDTGPILKFAYVVLYHCADFEFSAHQYLNPKKSLVMPHRQDYRDTRWACEIINDTCMLNRIVYLYNAPKENSRHGKNKKVISRRYKLHHPLTSNMLIHQLQQPIFAGTII